MRASAGGHRRAEKEAAESPNKPIARKRAYFGLYLHKNGQTPRFRLISQSGGENDALDRISQNFRHEDLIP